MSPLMTCHYPDLGSASDWLIIALSRLKVVGRHQYRIWDLGAFNNLMEAFTSGFILLISRSFWNWALFCREGRHATFLPTDKTNLKQGIHIHQPTAWPVPHAWHSHITRAVAAMESCFPFIVAHQHGLAVGSMNVAPCLFVSPLIP